MCNLSRLDSWLKRSPCEAMFGPVTIKPVGTFPVALVVLLAETTSREAGFQYSTSLAVFMNKVTSARVSSFASFKIDCCKLAHLLSCFFAISPESELPFLTRNFERAAVVGQHTQSFLSHQVKVQTSKVAPNCRP